MKANKKGISLIVLIITIVVIIILAATIILSITKSNPIKNANKAVDQSDMKTAQEAFILWLGDRWAQPALQYEVGCYYNGKVTDDGECKIYYQFTKTNNAEADSGTALKTAGEADKTTGALQPGDDQTFSTADFGLEQFDEIYITDNMVTKVVKEGVTLEYDITTGVVTSKSTTQSNNNNPTSADKVQSGT